MRTTVYWINRDGSGQLAIVPRPRGGDWLEDEVATWREAGLNLIVSLLEEDEAAELGLSQERELCQAAGLSFLSFPIVDRSVPISRLEALALVGKLGSFLAQGKRIGIHCRQSVGRASLVAASVLVAQGMDPHSAFQRIAEARGCAVPETPAQLEWVLGFAVQAAQEL